VGWRPENVGRTAKKTHGGSTESRGGWERKGTSALAKQVALEKQDMNRVQMPGTQRNEKKGKLGTISAKTNNKKMEGEKEKGEKRRI